MTPVGVLAELVLGLKGKNRMHDDGTMYRRDDSLEFARAHGIPIVTVQQIIAYRRQNGARAPPSVFEAGLAVKGSASSTGVMPSSCDA
ncbi:unnamed protein product, partial [Durusdinium trenchii]